MIYTAMPITNAVPAVLAARSGIVTLADLPPVTGRASSPG
jgi:2,4-diaminopentanoate dehydrogenase